MRTEPRGIPIFGVWEEEVDLAMDNEKKMFMGQEINQEIMKTKMAKNESNY